MSDYKKLTERALLKAKSLNKKDLNEGVLYPDGMAERMHPQLEKDISEHKHSLGNHPIFPDSDESSFEEKIMGERFKEVVTRYKRVFDVGEVIDQEVIRNALPLVKDTIKLEVKHRSKLEKLAVDMIRLEYDIDEDAVEFNVELVDRITLDGTVKEISPKKAELEFDSHDEIIQANKEVYKRRFLNALTQGAAKKCNHMFHMVDDELAELDPRLPSKYSKLMCNADYIFYLIPKLENSIPGGVVKVQFPSESNPKTIIHAQALVFPVLIHELVKGVMEVLSAHGLPSDKKLGNFVIGKSDFLSAEIWDMRLGPALWQRFTECIEPSDFDLKHHIYSDLASLPVDEFNIKMREIMAGTKKGKQIISMLVEEIKKDLEQDDLNNLMSDFDSKVDEDNLFDLDELINDDDDDDLFNYEDFL